MLIQTGIQDTHTQFKVLKFLKKIIVFQVLSKQTKKLEFYQPENSVIVIRIPETVINNCVRAHIHTKRNGHIRNILCNLEYFRHINTRTTCAR